MKKLCLLVLSLLTIFLVACNQIPRQDDPIPAVKYDLTFMVDETTVYHVFKVELGSPMQYPADPTKEGYIFTGWFTGEVEFEGDVVTANALTLYAHFVLDTSNVTTYHVNFYDGDVLFYSIDVEKNTVITETIDTTKENYTFDGWYMDSDFTTSFSLTNSIWANLDLYGKWNPIGHTVTFYQGASVFKTELVINGELLPTIDTNIEGYEFIGWYTNSNLTSSYVSGPVTGDLSLYGKWEQLENTVTLYNGSEIFQTIKVETGDSLPTINTNINGYDFNGWFTNQQLTLSYNNEPITSDLTLYGKWVQSETDPSYDFTGYYEDLNGLSGSTLINELYSLLNDTGQYTTTTYGEARDILLESDRWVGFNTNYIYLIYTDTHKGSVSNGYPDEGYAVPVWDPNSKWNREHVWAKSLFGTGDYDPSSSTRGIAADMHNLRASDTNVNSTRSNNKFLNQVYNAIEFGNIGSLWYPGDDHRGDVARIIFYMDIRWGNDTHISNIGDLSTFIAWHEADPVDAFEINRNNVIFDYQNNRNPFIDHPELVNMIYA